MEPLVVDTHTHVMSADWAHYPLQRVRMPSTAWVDECRVDALHLLTAMDAGRVHGAVLVQPHGVYGYDNRYVADARAVAPGRLVNAAVIDMTSPDRGAKLRRWAEAGVLGVRLFNIPPADPPWLGEPGVGDVLAVIAQHDLRVSVCVLPPDLARVGALCEQVGARPVALDHCGFDVGEPLRALAGHENLYLKISTTLLERFGGDPRMLVERLADWFGASRLMWGSDFPQHHRDPYGSLVALARHACSRLGAADRQRFLGATALELWPELVPDVA